MIAHRAFTMIEIMVVIFLIGVVATIAIPKLAYKAPQADWTTVLEDLNNLVLFARQEAIANQQVYRLTFSPNGSQPDTILLELEGRDPEKPDKKIYTPVHSYYMKTKYVFHPSVKMKAFYLNKKNQFTGGDGNNHCYIVHDGLVQDVLLHLSKIENNTEFKVSFKMQPFYGKFELMEGFVRPE